MAMLIIAVSLVIVGALLSFIAFSFFRISRITEVIVPS